jgi:hypothetical protein
MSCSTGKEGTKKGDEAEHQTTPVAAVPVPKTTWEGRRQKSMGKKKNRESPLIASSDSESSLELEGLSASASLSPPA